MTHHERTAYTKPCDFCGRPIRMAYVALNDTWQPFELGGDERHHCDPGRSGVGWPGGKCTYQAYCWWCGEEVFFHSNGHGDAVLLDRLGRPWIVHPCWEEHKNERSGFIARLRRLIGRLGIAGQREVVDLRNYIRDWGKASRPFELVLKLSAFDHSLLDQATRMIVQHAKAAGASLAGPIPLPCKKTRELGPGTEVRRHKRRLVIRKVPEDMMQALASISLTGGVDIRLVQRRARPVFWTFKP